MHLPLQLLYYLFNLRSTRNVYYFIFGTLSGRAAIARVWERDFLNVAA